MTAHHSLSAISAYAAARGAAPADPLRQSLAEARRRAADFQSLWNEDPPAGVTRSDLAATDRDGKIIPMRLFDPGLPGPARPVAAYFHGGGFALNSLDTHDRLMRQLALRSGNLVVGIGYGLAPELKYPGQLHQAVDAIAWLRRHAGALRLDADNIALAGDSAGANLALAATLSLRDQALPLPRAGILFYGMFSADLDTDSHRRFGGGDFGLTTERMDWFWRQYLAESHQRNDPLAAPLNADLQGLPPLLVIGAGLDCLLDDSRNLAEKLKIAGASYKYEVYDDAPHSFVQMSAILPSADRAVWSAADFIAGNHPHGRKDVD